MKSLQVDEELYTFIASQTREVGEDASAILRRILQLPARNGHGKPATVAAVTTSAPTPESPTRDGELLAFVASPEYRSIRSATHRFLAILGFAYRQSPADFEKRALSIR